MSMESKNFRAFVAAKVAIGVLNSLFNLYYVDMFINVYKLNEQWFFIGQVVYFLWNSINDPLFGWIQDNSSNPLGRRVPAIYYGGPLLCASFLIPWFPPPASFGDSAFVTGLHFIVSVCFFDGMFTYVCLAHCALFSDLTHDSKERGLLIRNGELGTILVAVPVFLSYLLFDRHNLVGFRTFCIVVSTCCGAILLYAGSVLDEKLFSTTPLHEQATNAEVIEIPGGIFLYNESGDSGDEAQDDSQDKGRVRHQHHQHHHQNAGTTGSSSMPVAAATTITTTTKTTITPVLTSLVIPVAASSATRPRSYSETLTGAPSLKQFLWELLSNQNFWAFVGVNFLQILNMSMAANFFTIFSEGLLNKAMDTKSRGFLMTLTELLPPVCVVAMMTNTDSKDSYFVIRRLLWLKLGMAALVYTLGQDVYFSVAFFLVFNRVIGAATFSLFNLPVSDVIDQDMAMYKRRQPMSSMFFGMNALFTKPAQSIAPLIVVHILTLFGYKASDFESTNDPSRLMPTTRHPEVLRNAMFMMLCLFPVVTGIAQLLIWAQYQLHGETLVKVKHSLARIKRAQDDNLKLKEFEL